MKDTLKKKKREYFRNYHLPQDFAGYTWIDTKVSVTPSCNKLIETNKSFENFSTNYKFVRFKNYKSVNSTYTSGSTFNIQNDYFNY